MLIKIEARCATTRAKKISKGKLMPQAKIECWKKFPGFSKDRIQMIFLKRLRQCQLDCAVHG